MIVLFLYSQEQYNGMFIYDVSARDVDTGINGVVDYMFIDGGEETQKTDAFQINPTTGVIHAEIIYDRETKAKYVVSWWPESLEITFVWDIYSGGRLPLEEPF